MNIITRDFIESKDNIFFAVTNYNHPKSHILAFPRYMSSINGNRMINGIRYKKLSSMEALDFLKKYHPDYFLNWNRYDEKMVAVPVDDIKKVYKPIEKLASIRRSELDNIFYEKIVLLTDVFHDYCGISYEDMGISGSTLIGLFDVDNSDIDLIIYGKENHRLAIDFFSKIKNDDEYVLNSIHGNFWKQVYDKRMFDDTFDLDEFIWYENRKSNRGIIQDSLFDISFNKRYDEIIDDSNLCYRRLENMKIICTIDDDSESYHNPAIYHVSNVEILEGEDRIIENIVSYTHTYTGIVKNNERVIASGVCEKCLNKETGEITYNLAVGTTRESINEYVKLEEKPIN